MLTLGCGRARYEARPDAANDAANDASIDTSLHAPDASMFVELRGVEGAFKASNPGMSDRFGFSLALSGDGNTLAVGAFNEASASRGVGSTPDDTLPGAGAVYVYRRTGSGWSFEAYVKASNPGADRFGIALALNNDGTTLAIGAQLEDSATTGVGSVPNEDTINAGALYVFRYRDATWSEEAYIKASNSGPSDYFGSAIALSGDGNTLAVSAVTESGSGTGTNPPDDDATGQSGAVYVFARTGSNWSQQCYVKASNTGPVDAFGTSIALSEDGNTLAVAATTEDGSGTGIDPTSDEGATDSGAVYLYARTDSGTWRFEHYIKASNTGAGDEFGLQVALSGDGTTLAVGASLEDTAGTGSNPSSNESASDAGAVYVYRQRGSTWTFETFLKSPNAGAGDSFGYAVALDRTGNTLAVGAFQEDSSSPGIGGGTNESAAGSGAVYTFTHGGTGWDFRQFIKSPNPDAMDQFGGAIELSMDGLTLAVGALGEDGSGSGVNAPHDNALRDSGAVYVYR